LNYYDADPSGRCLRRGSAAARLLGMGASNLAVAMVSLVDVVCVVGYRSLRRADHSSRGVLLSVMCVSVIVKPQKEEGPIPLGTVAAWKKMI
jgi:hypothetical protein